MTQSNPSLTFLGWDKPLIHLLAEWLWTDAERLRRRLVVVPTHQSGRHLREVLLERALKDGCGALLGPRVATPDDFFRATQVMPDSIRWAAWLEVLRNTTGDSVGRLFPSGIEGKDDGWRLGVAQQIEEARDLLASVDVGVDTVATVLPDEAERWMELSRLVACVQSQWGKWGFADPVQAKRKYGFHPVRPQGVDEIVLAGMPDPTWLAVQAWKALAKQGMQLTVLIGAPESFRGAFDDWGRPKPGFWIDRKEHSAPEPTQSLLAPDATALSKATVQACAGKTNREVAIGVCDPTFIPAVSRSLREAGWIPFDPQGTLLGKDGWPELLEALAKAIEAPKEYAALARVAKHPVIWAALLKAQDVHGCFAALEDWEKAHAATDADRVIGQLSAASKSRCLQAVGQFLEQIQGLLLEAQAGKTRPLEKSLRQWLGETSPELISTVEAEMSGWFHLDPEAFSLPMRLRWLAGTLSKLTRQANTSGAHVALKGWLELQFEPAPHLVLAGLHEGCVPETPAPNPLISDVVREKLGIRDRKNRLAREVFLYSALVEGRRQGGSVSVINSLSNPQGDPCKPSRVLLQAKPQDLPKRVLNCMTPAQHLTPEPTPAWARGSWLLRVPEGAPRNKQWSHLSPSTLKAYLDCPTRFYFSEVLGWEEFEPFEQELDGGMFGELLHQVFRTWASDETARELTNASQLKACWQDLLDTEIKTRFGTKLSPLMRLQAMSAGERLNALAEHQVKQCQEGWHIIASEKEYRTKLLVPSVPVVMRVDRIDQHEDGRVRVVDYKTAKKGTPPRKTHLRTWPKDGGREPLGPLVEYKGRQYGWIDLQLPLYALAVQEAMKLPVLPQAWYALLPEATSDTEFVQFEGLEIENALTWAKEASKRILEGVFWPPVPEVKYDPFEAIAPEGLQAALGSAWAEFLTSTPAEGGAPV